MFSTITLVFRGRLLLLLLYQWKQEWILYSFLTTAWWLRNCFTLHVAKVYFLELLLRIKTCCVLKTKFWSKTCGNFEQIYLSEYCWKFLSKNWKRQTLDRFLATFANNRFRRAHSNFIQPYHSYKLFWRAVRRRCDVITPLRKLYTMIIFIQRKHKKTGSI